jgi:hypothetical protein
MISHIDIDIIEKRLKLEGLGEDLQEFTLDSFDYIKGDQAKNSIIDAADMLVTDKWNPHISWFEDLEKYVDEISPDNCFDEENTEISISHLLLTYDQIKGYRIFNGLNKGVSNETYDEDYGHYLDYEDDDDDEDDDEEW